MVLTLRGQKYRYECENLCRLFFPYSPVKVDQEEPPRQGEPWALACIEEREGEYVYRVEAGDGDRSLTREETRGRLEEYGITDLLYRALSELTGYTPAWGMLTGIHPVKLLRQYAEELGEEAGAEKFRSHCHVSREKTDLALATLRGQQAAVEDLGENDFALYVSIPFCPTRCAYCSFVSQDMEHARKLMDPYFQLLLEEIGKTGQVAKDLGLSLRSVYIGGGTPTTLAAQQLFTLCGKIRETLDFSRCGEFTVEAGRPDTITKEKLQALLDQGISRISINPQTLSDQVLRNIGRKHTAQDTVEAFRLARSMGFENINADLIGTAGPGGLQRDGALPGSKALGPACDRPRGPGAARQAGGDRRHDGLLHRPADTGGVRALLPLPPDPHGREPGKHRLGPARHPVPLQRVHHGRVPVRHRLRRRRRHQTEGPLQPAAGADLQL